MSPVQVLLDTDILSEVLKGIHPIAVRNAKLYRARFGVLITSTISVVEIVKGFRKAGHGQRIRIFLEHMAAADVRTLNLQSAGIAGDIVASLEKAGAPIGAFDPLIAAIALEQNLALASGNIAHYQKIQQVGFPLQLQNWKEQHYDFEAV